METVTKNGSANWRSSLKLLKSKKKLRSAKSARRYVYVYV